MFIASVGERKIDAREGNCVFEVSTQRLHDFSPVNANRFLPALVMLLLMSIFMICWLISNN